MKFNKSTVILLFPLIIGLAGGAVLITKSADSEENIITGVVETATIDVASKIPGRIDTILVSEGDAVVKGQVLARLESKEMAAKLEQARGMMDAARSKMAMAHNGARPEEKEAAEKLYRQAKAQYELAEKTWRRIQSLFKDEVISAQEKDQVEFQYKAASEQMEAARAKLDMVKNGARYEEVAAAEALYHQAENGFNEATAYYQELELKSPVSGEISKKITDAGEIIAGGYPLFSIINPNDNWVVLQIREDKLAAIRKGAEFQARIPALGNEKFVFKVTYIAPMAEFATWKATNQKGDFDLKTFEVHLKSKNIISGLRAGMTVNVIL